MLETIIAKLWNNITKITTGITTAAVAATLFAARPAQAYEVPVHQWITQQAVEYIKEKGYADIYNEVKPLEDLLVGGVADEDAVVTDDCNSKNIVWPRFLRHFYRPIDNKGYCLPLGNSCIQFITSKEWGLDNPDNLCDLTDARALYKAGKKERAYYALAHVAHLLQDGTVPEHAHLEPHPFVALGGAKGVVLYDQHGFEHYTLVTLEKEGKLPVPKDNAQFKWFKIRPIEHYFELGPRVAYTINRFYAKLNDTTKKGKEVDGLLGWMFPSLHYQDSIKDIANIGWRIDGDDWKHGQNPRFEGMWRGDYSILDDWWEIVKYPYPRNTTEKPGWFYVSASMQAFPKARKSGWTVQFISRDSFDAHFRFVLGNEFYEYYEQIHQLGWLARFADGKRSLAAIMAEELVPLAIQETAGAIISFYQQMNPVHEKSNQAIAVRVEPVNIPLIDFDGSTNVNRKALIASSFVDGKEQKLIVTPTTPIIKDICDIPGKESIRQHINLEDRGIYLQIYDTSGKRIYNKRDEGIDYNIYSLANIVKSDPQYEIVAYRYFTAGTDAQSVVIYKCFGATVEQIYGDFFSSSKLPNLKNDQLQEVVGITFLPKKRMKVFFRYHGYNDDSQEIALQPFTGLFEYNTQKRTFVEIKQ